ncbi:penicillin-binding protein 2 [Nonomuraea sp. NBC_01738]|uniref:penicillin-binding protein 2 n=1 Tax=Nonomuraea sp. NBC_01738 TaxID=2976003 RepID=UPI002E141E12|nr:penicillin-binding protein 2 [Nonomuraea sp. NBC_01738]
MLIRLWDVQVRHGDSYARAAAEDHVRHVVVPPVRGEILDDRGRPLVRNRTQPSITVDHVALARQLDGGRAVLGRLAGVLGVPAADLARRVRLCTAEVAAPCWPGSPYQPIPVAERVGTRVALQIAERPEAFPGISAEPRPVRDHPLGELAAHTLGYVAPSGEADPVTGVGLAGRDGLEARYDADLRGRAGSREVVVDTTGQVVRTVSEVRPVTGNTLLTSIDAKVQAVAEKALRDAAERAGKKGLPADEGAAVVMDVRTGRVVALAAYPGYDPNVWTGGISRRAYASLRGRLQHRAIQGMWPPGSTWKITSAAAAVKAGYGTGARYDCPGSFMVGARAFRNYGGIAQGTMTLSRALTASCDTIFYRFAYEMWLRDGGTEPVKHPRDPMQRMARAFGFGKATGIDLPGEAAGRLPTRDWKRAYWKGTRTASCTQARKARNAYVRAIAAEQCRQGYMWWAGDAANFSIGQGDVLVTPLQLARAYAALANGGTLWRPTLAKAVLRPGGGTDRVIRPHRDGKVPVPGKALAYIRRALAAVPSSGTAAGAFRGFPLDRLPVAGKTGTAESYGKRDTSWFASFAPADRPRLAVVVVISQGGTGAGAAAPAVRDIWSGIYGLDGRKAALPALAKKLPKARPTEARLSGAGPSGAASREARR